MIRSYKRPWRLASAGGRGPRKRTFAHPARGVLCGGRVPAGVELGVLAKYPFLREASAYIQSEGVPLEEVLGDPAYARARAAGKARVLEALERGPEPNRVAVAPADQLSQLLAYPVARILVSALEDTYLIRRFALREAIVAEALLKDDSDDVVVHLAAQLPMDLRREDGGFRLHFSDFLRFTSTMRETPWKLINQRVERGFVRLRRDKALRVLRNAIQRHIEQGLPLPVNDEIWSAFRTDLREIRGLLDAKKATFKAEDIGKVSITRFPPCMYNLLAQIQNHENVPHMGRFAIVAFLHHIGLGNEEIFRVFGDVPDFAADVTKYQIDHITGTSSPTEYTPPECSTMKSYGICPGPDRICLSIRHPLSNNRLNGRETRPRRESPATAV
ncbi:MAG: DNA primase regulatory subunit PriL [Methanobacteriota archaeon]|nr:MAG: DNA primase regulatory subunit PriL [Euryarchaeota archaeon]